MNPIKTNYSNQIPIESNIATSLAPPQIETSVNNNNSLQNEISTSENEDLKNNANDSNDFPPYLGSTGIAPPYYFKAMLALQKALDIYCKNNGEKSELDKNALCTSLKKVAERFEALEYNELALKYRLRILNIIRERGAVSRELAYAYTSVAICLDKLGRHDEALEQHKLAIDICMSNSTTLSYYSGFNDIAKCLFKLNKFNEALGYFQQVLDMHLKIPNVENNHFAADAYHHIALCYNELNLYEKALENFQNALNIYHGLRMGLSNNFIGDMQKCLMALGLEKEAVDLDEMKQKFSIEFLLACRDLVLPKPIDFFSQGVQAIKLIVPEKNNEPIPNYTSLTNVVSEKNNETIPNHTSLTNNVGKEEKLQECPVSPKKIDGLFGIVQRNLHDAQIVSISSAGRYVMAYEAALQLASIVMHASGLRLVLTEGHHEETFQSVTLLMGEKQQNRSKYFNKCRVIRNNLQYLRTISDGSIDKDLQVLFKEVLAFKDDVIEWLLKTKGIKIES